MRLFRPKIKTTTQTAQKIDLEKEFEFMYDCFIVAGQWKLYLLLEENEGVIDALTFDFLIYKFGYPNDETGLPSQIPGVKNYSFSRVTNSVWLEELKQNNRSHPKDSGYLFSRYEHYIIRFKDVTLEVISKSYSVETMTADDFNEIIKTERSYLSRS